MKIYTGSGDKGNTSLFSGERISKAEPRIDAYGDLDELNAVMGLFIARLPATGDDALKKELVAIQADLMDVGAVLATTPDSPMRESLHGLAPNAATGLERAIDRMSAVLPPLQSFILPGGHEASALAHVARTVCRRVERRVVRLHRGEAAGNRGMEAVLVYLNRLSDYFFVVARHVNHLTGTSEIAWRGRETTP